MTERQRKIAALQKEQALFEEFVATRQAAGKRDPHSTKGKKKAKYSPLEHLFYAALLVAFIAHILGLF
jgi:hypothetical protein